MGRRQLGAHLNSTVRHRPHLDRRGLGTARSPGAAAHRRAQAHALKVADKVVLQGALKAAVATQCEPTVTSATGALKVAVTVPTQFALEVAVSTQCAPRWPLSVHAVVAVPKVGDLARLVVKVGKVVVAIPSPELEVVGARGRGRSRSSCALVTLSWALEAVVSIQKKLKAAVATQRALTVSSATGSARKVAGEVPKQSALEVAVATQCAPKVYIIPHLPRRRHAVCSGRHLPPYSRQGSWNAR